MPPWDSLQIEPTADARAIKRAYAKQLKQTTRGEDMTGVGIDIVDVERIGRLHQRYRERFLKRVFTETEVAYSFPARGGRRYERLAARFAAKEAVIKAIGYAVPLHSIEVKNNTSGRPTITCAAVGKKIEASLSHTDRLAIAYVLIEGD